MKQDNRHFPIPASKRIGSIVLVTMVGLLLALAAVTAQGSPDFGDSYKTGPQYAEQDSLIFYTIVAVNTGEPVQNVVLSDTLPSGVAFIPGSCSYVYGGNSWACEDDLSRMWQANFATGDRVTTTFAVRVTAGTLGFTLTNYAYLTWDSGQEEMSTTTFVGTPPPDFSSSYKDAAPYVRTGDVLTYTIVAANTGGPVQNVVLSDTLPGGVLFVPDSCTYTYNDSSWPCGDLDQMWQERFATGDRITTTFAVTVTAGTLVPPLENCAYLGWDGGEEEICFRASVVETVPNFDSSYKTGSSAAGTSDTIRYTIVAVNTGEMVQNVVLSDTLPSGVQFVPGSCTFTHDESFWLACGDLSQIWRERLDTGDRITTTFAVTVTAGTLALPVENCAYLSWGDIQHPLCWTTTLNPLRLYLPLIMRMG